MARAMKDSGIAWIGEIAEGFEVIKLKYLSGILDQYRSPITADKRNQDADVLYDYYGASGAIDKIDGYTIDDHVMLIGEDGANLKMRNLPLMYEVNGKAWINNHAHILKPKSEVDFYYIFYALEALDLNTYITGSAQPKLSQENLKNIWIPIPQHDVQIKISMAIREKCQDIDALIEQTRASIEEYKKLKQAVITQAVTKGIRPNRPMKDSGVEWIGEVPADWQVYRIANLYDERNESGSDDLPILTVSINSGISDHEVADEDQARVFVRSEDKTKYKRVYPGDLAYNMMRAWQGAFGAVRVDGMISPAYVVAKPKQGVTLDSRYVEALLRTPSAIEEMHRYSHGITDFRLRLYWPEFKNIRICVPEIEEQCEIADYIDRQNQTIDDLIAKKEHIVSELLNYKQSIIYEYVTGKKEVSVP